MICNTCLNKLNKNNNCFYCKKNTKGEDIPLSPNEVSFFQGNVPYEFRKIIKEFIDSAYEDYISSRENLMDGNLIKGVSESCSTIEKILKAIYCFEFYKNYQKPSDLILFLKQKYKHEVLKLYEKEIEDKISSSFRLNKDYLKFLETGYNFRYKTDINYYRGIFSIKKQDSRLKFAYYIHNNKSLYELDYSVSLFLQLYQKLGVNLGGGNTDIELLNGFELACNMSASKPIITSFIKNNIPISELIYHHKHNSLYSLFTISKGKNSFLSYGTIKEILIDNSLDCFTEITYLSCGSIESIPFYKENFTTVLKDKIDKKLKDNNYKVAFNCISIISTKVGGEFYHIK